MKKYVLYLFLLLFYSCSPIKSSSKDGKHQLELTLNEVQTNIDDLRHDLQCFKTDLKIVDTKVNNQEKNIYNIKHTQISQLALKLESLINKLKNTDLKNKEIENTHTHIYSDADNLAMKLKEAIHLSKQHKNKIEEIEKNVIAQQEICQEVVKLKQLMEIVTDLIDLDKKSFSIYEVRAGDSLEKIAKTYKVTTEQIKKTNNLESDLMIIGQKLKIPKQKK